MARCTRNQCQREADSGYKRCTICRAKHRTYLRRRRGSQAVPYRKIGDPAEAKRWQRMAWRINTQRYRDKHRKPARPLSMTRGAIYHRARARGIR